MSSKSRRGLLMVVSAPSATGKTTVVEQLVQVLPHLHLSRSYTSRPARAGEENGVDYNFISRDEFQAMVARDAFLEWADVFGHFYGTGRDETQARLSAGEDLVLVIDVQGARQVRARIPETVAVFMLPPSFAVLSERLRKRSKDPEADMLRRLETARREVDAAVDYDYVVVNDLLEKCVGELAGIVVAERARLTRRRTVIDPIIATFRDR